MEEAKILVVEDERDIRDIIEFFLKSRNYKPTCFASAEDAKPILAKEGFDLLLLDWMLPGINGHQFIQYIRQQCNKNISQIPIIMLSAKSTMTDQVKILESGADDYLTKPFDKENLYARINSLLRRTKSGNTSVGEAEELQLLQYKEFEWDNKNFSVSFTNNQLVFSFTEFYIFGILLSKPKQIVKKDEIISFVWKGRDSSTVNRTLDVHITRIRNKLQTIGLNKNIIQTVRKQGYKFDY